MKDIENFGNFSLPADIVGRYEEIAEVYKEAFAGPPWFEVGKCPSFATLACVGGFTKLAIGEECNRCNLPVAEEAYTTEELVERFTDIGEAKKTIWYTEEIEGKFALCAFGWVATPSDIAAEKYSDTPAMQDWLPDTLGDEPVIWLDEVFADRRVRPSGNLRNFDALLQGMKNYFGLGTLAFRTITPQMLAASVRAGAEIARNVPDRRQFVISRSQNGTII